jgi:O-antigen ligase
VGLVCDVRHTLARSVLMRNQRKCVLVILVGGVASFTMLAMFDKLALQVSFTWALLFAVLAPLLVFGAALSIAHSVCSHVITRTVRWWQVLWVLMFLSGLVFRTRTAEDIRASGVDAWAMYRIGLMTICGIVLIARLRNPETAWLHSLKRGLLGAFAIYCCICLFSTVWSIYPSWTAYKSLEYATDVALVAATVSSLSSEWEADQVLHLAFFLVGVVVVTIWLGVLIWPKEALRPSSGVIPFQLFGVVPFFSTNIVGEFGAIISVVAVSYLTNRNRHYSLLTPAVIVAVGLVTLLLSQTRSAILAFGAGVLFAFIVNWSPIRLTAALSGTALLYLNVSALAQKFMLRGEDPSGIAGLNGRAAFWTTGIESISAHLLTGIGAYAGGRFGVLEQIGQDAVTLHNTYVEVLVGTGIPGLIAILFVLVGTWWTLLKKIRQRSAGSDPSAAVAAGSALAVLTVRSFFDTELIWHTAFVFFAIVLYAESMRRQRSAPRATVVAASRALIGTTMARP